MVIKCLQVTYSASLMYVFHLAFACKHFCNQSKLAHNIMKGVKIANLQAMLNWTLDNALWPYVTAKLKS